MASKPNKAALAALSKRPSYLPSLFEVDDTDHRDPLYQQWVKNNGLQESPDYNLFAAFNAGMNPDARGHLGDRFKLPNHPTFSTESQYSGQNGDTGGRWLPRNKSWIFQASPTNMQNMSEQQLMQYFDTVEPGNTIQFPGGRTYTGKPR